jgi:preprotein translocase subunit SecA
MNRHRKATYVMRREILMQSDISKRIKLFIEDEVQTLAGSPHLLSEDFESEVKEVFPFDEPALDRLFDTDTTKFADTLKQEALELYEGRETAFTSDIMRKVERDIYLQVLDNLWMQHLESMDHLREGIHWMSVGQRDPLVEYRRQSQILFDQMQQQLRHDVLQALFNAQPISADELDDPIETDLTRAARQSVDNAGQ